MFAKVLVVSALAALAAAQSGVLSFTHVANPVTAGQPQAITYATNDTTTPVTILLRKGPSNNLQTISVLTDHATGGQYIWTPSTSLEDGSDYALEITQGTQTNYQGPLSVQGASGNGISSSNSTQSATGSSASSAIPATATGNTTAITTNMPAPIPIATGTNSMGTGVPIMRNTTMSSATISSTRTSSVMTSTMSAGFQSSTSASATHTNAASAANTGSSVIALVFGAVAAVLFC